MASICARRFCSHNNRGIKNLIVCGAGLMGSGIAEVAAQTNHKVLLVDQNAEALQKAFKRISSNLEKQSKKQDKVEPHLFVQSSLANIQTKEFDPSKESSPEINPDVDLIIEAIVENINTKHKLFEVLDSAAPENTIFASNTSSLPITEIFKHTSRQDRTGGLHYFNPVPRMKLLEVIRGDATSNSTFEKLCSFGNAMNKTIVKVGVSFFAAHYFGLLHGSLYSVKIPPASSSIDS